MAQVNQAHAHWRVRETAIAMGHQLYDHLMHDNDFNRIWKERYPDLNSKQREELFVAKNLYRLLPQARATLTQMLNMSYDDVLKEHIYEALLLDATLVRGRSN